MIKIGYQKFEIDNCLVDFIKEKMESSTCKTNLTPQLIFKQSFTGITDKTFVGNWTKKGFWLSKYRYQLFQARPDIIARFNFISNQNNTQIEIKYSIGFSSILIIMILALPILAAFSLWGIIGFIVGLILMSLIYYILSASEYDSIKESIKEKILSRFEIKQIL